MFKTVEGYSKSNRPEAKFETVRVRDIGDMDKFDTKFTAKMSEYKTKQSPAVLIEMAKMISAKIIAKRDEGVHKGKGASQGDAYFQGFLERMLLRGTLSAGVLSDPNFINELQKTVHELPFHVEGARATVAYILELKRDPKCVFIGQNVDLDTMHATDLVVGYEGDGDEAIAGEEYLGLVQFVQIKKGRTTPEDRVKIQTQHRNYVAGMEQYMDQEAKTDLKSIVESAVADEEFRNSYIEIARELVSTISEQVISNYDDLAETAEILGRNPVDARNLILALNEGLVTLLLSGDMAKVKKVMNLREAVGTIRLPLADYASYNKLKAPDTVSIVGAGQYQSVIVERVSTISNTVTCIDLVNEL